MSDYNQENNRAVWFDIPVVELARATIFYTHVLAAKVEPQTVGTFEFAVIEHKDGNGGCLVPNSEEVTQKGIMLYLNVDGRIRDSLQKVNEFGGSVVQDVHSIGPHGFRAIVIDSEGNKIILHSLTDG